MNKTVEASLCLDCASDTYSVNSVDSCEAESCGERSCNPCPAGLNCLGGLIQSKVQGSRWERQDTFGKRVLMRVKSCPEGYVLVRSLDAGLQAASIDDCARCPPGLYSLEVASLDTKSESASSDPSQQLLVTSRPAELERRFELCLTCPLSRADCLVGQRSNGSFGQTVKATEGFWLGTSMMCPQKACGKKNGVCQPDMCSPMPVSVKARRTACEGTCRVSAMLYACPPGHCTQNHGSLNGSGMLIENACRDGHEGPACAR